MRFVYIPSSGISLSYVDLTESSSASVTGSASIAAGDLLIHMQFRGAFSTPATQTPTDFTALKNSSDSLSRGIISYKIADGDGASASITGMSTGIFSRNFLLVARPDKAISNVATTTFATQITNSDPAARSISMTTLGHNGIGVAFFYHEATPTIVFSPVTGNTSKTGLECNTYWSIQNGSKSDISVDIDDTGYTMMMGGGIGVY